MGLAASQCRLLLLTARLSDTEYRAQMISQRRMALAMQTEQIATNYSRALNNRILKFTYDFKSSDNTPIQKDLTYYELTAENSALAGKYRVKTADGKIAVASVDEIPGTIYSTKDEDGNEIAANVTKESLIKAARKYLAGCTEETEDSKDLQALISSDNLTDSDYAALYTYLKNTDALNSQLSFKKSANATFTGSDGEEYIVLPAIANTQYFQNCLRTGALCTERYTQEGNEAYSWKSYNLLSSEVVDDDLYTADDAAAQAEYESKSAMIQSQDKFLEIELKQVETQHQAAQTEYDSVKKVIDKNIERSFKTFG